MAIVTDPDILKELIREEVRAAIGSIATDPQPEVFDTQGAAAYCGGISRAMLERLRVTGGGPRFVKFGNLVRYRKADLDNWMAERVVASTSERAAS